MLPASRASKFQFGNGTICESGLGQRPSWGVVAGLSPEAYQHGSPALVIGHCSLLLPTGDPKTLTFHIGHSLCVSEPLGNLCLKREEIEKKNGVGVGIPKRALWES